ncbi:hypothetical protein AKJ16_DCAP23420 [Drosera capensis]
MAKRGRNKNNTTPGTDPRNRSTPTMREEASGKKKKVTDERSMLKLKHLENLAIWAARECVIGSLGAVYGRRFAELGDGLGVEGEAGLVSCQSGLCLIVGLGMALKWELLCCCAFDVSLMIEFDGLLLLFTMRCTPLRFQLFYASRLRRNAAVKRNCCVALLLVERCETILQPGFNCKVRIEKNQAKKPRRKMKRLSAMENNVVYTCHFCSHKNLKRGTPKGHIKGITLPKLPTMPAAAKPVAQKISVMEQTTVSETQVKEKGDEASPAMSKSVEADCPVTPSVKPRASLLLDSKRKRKALGLKKTADPEISLPVADTEKTSETSRKRRRKSWTTLKEIAESSEHERIQKISSVAVPCPL